MKQFKLSILSQECQWFMITPTTLKKTSISIYEAIMSNTWQAKNETCGNCIKCVAHHPKGLVVSISRTHKHKKIWNSFFNVDMMTTSTKTICPKKQLSSSSVVGSIIVCTRFKCL
jgi:NADH:ubiquinone oxidoreductase subunit F (NADH-binding)